MADIIHISSFLMGGTAMPLIFYKKTLDKILQIVYNNTITKKERRQEVKQKKPQIKNILEIIALVLTSIYYFTECFEKLLNLITNIIKYIKG